MAYKVSINKSAYVETVTELTNAITNGESHIVIAPGSYTLTSTVAISTDTLIEGSGKDITTLIGDGTITTLLSMNSVNDIRIKDITFNLNHAVSGTNLSLGSTGSVTNCKIENCDFTNNNINIGIGLTIQSTNNLIVNDCHFQRTNDSIISTGLNVRTLISNCVIDANNLSYEGISTDTDITLTSNRFTGNSIILFGTNFNFLNNNLINTSIDIRSFPSLINGNIFSGNSLTIATIIQINTTTTDTVISNNIFKNLNTTSTVISNSSGTRLSILNNSIEALKSAVNLTCISNSTGTDCVIEGNTISNVGTPDISISNTGSGAIIRNNKITGAVTTAISNSGSNANICGNSIISTTTTGISNTSNNVVISNNTISSTCTNGINTSGDNNNISNNTLIVTATNAVINTGNRNIISGNTISGTNTTGISSTATDCNISNNTMTGSITTGIAIGASSARTEILGNLSSITSTAITVSSTGNDFVHVGNQNMTDNLTDPATVNGYADIINITTTAGLSCTLNSLSESSRGHKTRIIFSSGPSLIALIVTDFLTGNSNTLTFNNNAEYAVLEWDGTHWDLINNQTNTDIALAIVTGSAVNISGSVIDGLQQFKTQNNNKISLDICVRCTPTASSTTTSFNITLPNCATFNASLVNAGIEASTTVTGWYDTTTPTALSDLFARPVVSTTQLLVSFTSSSTNEHFISFHVVYPSST